MKKKYNLIFLAAGKMFTLMKRKGKYLGEYVFDSENIVMYGLFK